MLRFLGRLLLRKAWLAGVLAALGTSVCLALDINTASEADLDGLRGLGPATTRLILIEREKALFKNWPDLLRGSRASALRARPNSRQQA